MNLKSKVFSNERRLLIILLTCWFVFLLINSIITPLHVDECYYRLFGQNLAWGYFDHPPGVAVITYLSSFISSGILGVRFFSILIHILSFLLIFRIVKKPKENNSTFLLAFFLFFISLPLNHLYGFITTPDVPLLFSTALFFLMYKRVVEKGKLLDFLLWGIVMALMMYSKYHGALVILFTLISNRKLFLDYKTYIAGALGLILLIPHFNWQYEHGFASFMYHLSERMVVFKSFYPLEYWLNVLLVINPLFVRMFIKVIRKVPKDKFLFSLYVNLIGFILFFAYQSFKVHVQPQWILLIYIPFIVLFFNDFKSENLAYLRTCFLVLIPIYIFMHACMIFDILPSDLDLHRQKEYTEMIQKDSKGKPVMFYGSYGRAAVYSWYQDQDFVHSQNGPRHRKNQFNIWNEDLQFQLDSIYMVGEYGHGDWYTSYKGNYYGVPRKYYPIDKAQVKPINMIEKGDSIYASVEFTNPYDFPIDLNHTHAIRTYYFEKGKSLGYSDLIKGLTEVIPPQSKDTIDIQWKSPTSIEYDKIGLATAHIKGLFGPVYAKKALDVE